MSNAERISAEEARRRVEQGALLVCDYDDAAKCAKYALRGALSLDELLGQESLAKEREVLLYCA
jgi:hypothetical protein